MKKLKQKIKLFIEKSYYFVLSRFFMKNQVVFCSFGGIQYSDSPKAFSEYLHKKDPKIKQVWLFRDPTRMKEVVPKHIKCVELNTKNWIKYISSSKALIDNDYFVYCNKLSQMPKSKKQIFVQTWHGDKGFKRCFYTVKGFKPEMPFSLEKQGVFDYFLVGCEREEPLIYKMFNYKGDLLKIGLPRNDVLFEDNQEKVKQIKKELGISQDTKILLYAPTFREYTKDFESIDLDGAINALKKTTKKDWVVVYRAHHSAFKSNNKYIDGNQFGDMADILPISDMLISDYSSCVGDFALTKKPIILYIADFDNYTKKDRGLHFDLKDTPFMIAKNNDELTKIIKDITKEKAEKNDEDILAFYGNYEKGDACENLYKKIIKR